MGGRGATSSIANRRKVLDPNKPISRGKTSEKINLDSKAINTSLKLTKEIASLYNEMSKLSSEQINNRIKILSMLYDKSESDIRKRLGIKTSSIPSKGEVYKYTKDGKEVSFLIDSVDGKKINATISGNNMSKFNLRNVARKEISFDIDSKFYKNSQRVK